MKLFFTFLLFSPFIVAAQSTGRSDDSLRKSAEKMKYPSPFLFTKTNHTFLNKKQALVKAGQWLQDIKDSLKAIVIVKDTSRYRLTATNVAASPDISFSIIIRIEQNQYTCWLQNYIFHTINGKAMPLQKAVSIKEFKETAEIEMLLIMRAYPGIFQSLENAMK